MSSNALAPCPDCGHLISQLAETCPSCARPLKKPAVREGLFLRTLNRGVAFIFGYIAFMLIVPLIVAMAAYLTYLLLR
jgi:predicted amidophosphoribosyltransferase